MCADGCFMLFSGPTPRWFVTLTFGGYSAAAQPGGREIRLWRGSAI